MKKLLTICAMGAIGCSVYAQGLVSINENTATISTNTTSQAGTSGKLVSGGNAYYFELLVMADPTASTTLPSVTETNLSSWSDSGISGTNGAGLGAGHVVGISATTGVAVNGWAAGATDYTIVVGWSANEGSSWSAVSAAVESENGWATSAANGGLFGMSSPGYLVAGQAPAPYPTVFGTNPGQLGVFSLTPVVTSVPEPGTLALAALGGASLLMFRRKK